MRKPANTFRPEPDEACRQFEEEVFPTELDYIADRRRSVGDDRAGQMDPGAPGTANDLVGLALSGGGIRSASFSLGFLQSLGTRLFRRIDYLSTVSGGGYIGSAISSLMANSFYRGQGAAFPFSAARNAEEPPALSHLRNNSNYMAPDGPSDIFRLLAVLVRGIILNSLALLPFLFLICLAVLLVYGQQLSDRARYDDQVKRIDSLIDRYYGDRLTSEREIDPLLAVLEAEALLRIDEGKNRGDVIHGLRAALSFQDGSEQLISGNGTGMSPYRLTPAASRKDFARTLLEGDVLQPNEVIEEVALIARELEKQGYRHCQLDPQESDSADAADCDDDDYKEELISLMHEREMIRSGSDLDALMGFVEEHWRHQLKPVLQALYNGEYLDEEFMERLVYDELGGRPPFYTYGWYEARVGVTFPYDWYSENYLFAEFDWIEEWIESELTQLAAAFGEQCIQGDGEVLPTCLRPTTNAVDVLQLLEFEELIAGRADGSLQNPPLRSDWARLRQELAAIREGDGIADVVEALYLGEYLREEWVWRTIRDAGTSTEEPAEEWQRFANIFYDIDDSYYELSGYDLHYLPFFKKEVVCADIVEILLDKGLQTTPDCPDFYDIDIEELTEIFREVWHLLDQQSVNRLLYAYHYGWHRSRLGYSYPSDWCAAMASRGDENCPESSNEAWAELSRALRDPSRWNPNQLSLPFTWVAARAALGWVLLLPLLLLVARSIYRRRQVAVAREANPLRALLTSDQSLNWRSLYERTFGLFLVVILSLVVVELLPYAVHYFHYLNLQGQSPLTFAIGALSLLLTALSGPALALLQRFGRTVALVVLVVAGPLLVLIVFGYIMEYAVYPPPSNAGSAAGLFADNLLWSYDGGRRLLNPAAAWLVFAVTGVASIGLAMLIDINATSLHGLYRDRIAKAFMVGLDTAGDIEPEEDLPLQQICPSGSGAPYHLVNVALNLQGNNDRSLRGRNSDFLFFSRDYIGGPRTGFCRTRDMAWVCPQAHLSTAMAVSGAAVSPNMGRYKTGPIAVLMTLLNMRLALWIPHPGAVRKWFAGLAPDTAPARPPGARLLDAWRRLRLRSPATLLLRECIGAIDDRGPVINVSDGGHIENTGALELLRRRCREIILVDGEADPDMAFGGLALLQRIARIDMGIDIEIDVSALRRNENGLSESRSATGIIRYPARKGCDDGEDLVEETGRLLYVKLAVTGTEEETVAEYRARNKAFPHESTGDQAFGEGQFEAYRRLGQLAGQEAFENSEMALDARPRNTTDPEPDSGAR